KHYAEAIEKFRQAAKVNPRFARAFTNWGYALALQGHMDSAVARYEQSLRVGTDRLGGDMAITYARLGDVLTAKGLYERAIKTFHAALDRDPRSLTACFGLGRALEKRGRVSEAVEMY